MNTKIAMQLEKNNNILLYRQNLYEIYKKDTKTAVYITTPKKGKSAVELILKTLDDKQVTRNKTVSQLIDDINEHTRHRGIHIYLNYFEQLAQRELQYYRQLEENRNIQIIANICEDRKLVDQNFVRKFVILSDTYYENRAESINIKYTLLLLVSVLIFLIFLKIQLSILNILVSTLWFTFLMYRSFSYMIH